MRLGFFRSVVGAIRSVSTSTGLHVVDGTHGVAYVARGLNGSAGKRRVELRGFDACGDFYVVANSQVAIALTGQESVEDRSPREFLIPPPTPSALFMPREWRLEWKAADVPAHYLEGIGRRITRVFGHYALPDWWGAKGNVVQIAVSDRVYYGHWHDTKTFAACALYGLDVPILGIAHSLADGRILVARLPDDAPGFVAGELAVAIGDDESDELEFPWGVIGYGERWFTAWKLPVRREDEEVFVSWATGAKTLVLSPGNYALLVEE